MDRLKKIALTTFIHNWTDNDFKNAKVANFKGNEIVEESFILEDYLKKNGLFASRFYLLTDSAELKEKDIGGESEFDDDEEEEGVPAAFVASQVCVLSQDGTTPMTRVLLTVWMLIEKSTIQRTSTLSGKSRSTIKYTSKSSWFQTQMNLFSVIQKTN